MATKNINPPVIVIFGITGDLSKRKLLPALYHLIKAGTLPYDTQIIGTSRHPLTNEDLINTVELSVLDKDKACDPVALQKMNSALKTIQLDPSNHQDYDKLKKLLDTFDKSYKRQRQYYMSVPSKAFEPIINRLAGSKLNDLRSSILLEKPFGYDLVSAENLIQVVNKAFKEHQIYRIDHYLAKETAQNLLAFRLHNPIFSPLWNCQYIQRVTIRAFETIGIEGRANFYEQMGAVRDFVQSHLMQLMSITLMDLPNRLDSFGIHQTKQQFLKGLLPADPKQAIRAQYDAYKREVSNPNSFTETYCRLVLKHSEPKWHDTEIILETGKAMDRKTTDITIEFKTPHERRRNSLTFHIQPNEGISLDLIVKEPGLENTMRHAALDFSYDATFKDYEHIDAYERVLMDVARGDQSLFASDQEVLQTWRVLQPILDKWSINDDGLKNYTAGSKGP